MTIKYNKYHMRLLGMTKSYALMININYAQDGLSQTRLIIRSEKQSNKAQIIC